MSTEIGQNHGRLEAIDEKAENVLLSESLFRWRIHYKGKLVTLKNGRYAWRHRKGATDAIRMAFIGVMCQAVNKLKLEGYTTSKAKKIVDEQFNEFIDKNITFVEIME